MINSSGRISRFRQIYGQISGKFMARYPANLVCCTTLTPKLINCLFKIPLQYTLTVNCTRKKCKLFNIFIFFSQGRTLRKKWKCYGQLSVSSSMSSFFFIIGKNSSQWHYNCFKAKNIYISVVYYAVNGILHLFWHFWAFLFGIFSSSNFIILTQKFRVRKKTFLESHENIDFFVDSLREAAILFSFHH